MSVVVGAGWGRVGRADEGARRTWCSGVALHIVHRSLRALQLTRCAPHPTPPRSRLRLDAEGTLVELEYMGADDLGGRLEALPRLVGLHGACLGLDRWAGQRGDGDENGGPADLPAALLAPWAAALLLARGVPGAPPHLRRPAAAEGVASRAAGGADDDDSAAAAARACSGGADGVAAFVQQRAALLPMYSVEQ